MFRKRKPLNLTKGSKRKRRRLLFLASGALAGLASIQFPDNSLHAQESRWTSSVGGDFGFAGFWDNGVPSPGIDAIFDLNATYGVDSNSDHVFQSLAIHDGNVDFLGGNQFSALGSATVSRGSLTISNGSFLKANQDLVIGSSILGPATLNIGEGGRVENGNAYVGRFNGNVGEVALTDPFAIWTSSNLFLGTSDGSSDGGIGHVTVNYATSLGVGNGPNSGSAIGAVSVEDFGNNGNLYVRNGSTIDTPLLFVGNSNGTNGHVTLSGSGSRINSLGRIGIGNEGTGTLNISDGAIMTGLSLHTGAEPVLSIVGGNANITVSGQNSLLDLESTISLARTGNGLLTIEDGGRVEGLSGFIASRYDAVGAIEVRGPGSQLNVSNLVVGEDGQGSVLVETGGNVSVNSAIIGDNFNSNSTTSSGLVDVSGTDSQLNVANDLTVGRQGVGEIRISDRGTVTSANGTVASDNGIGSATISDAGSSWTIGDQLQIGNKAFGTGELVIENGGIVSVVNTSLGAESLGLGKITVDGAGSRFQNTNDLVVGTLGAGSIEVTDGGVFATKNTTVNGESSSIRIHGTGSRFENGGAMLLAEQGFGSLEVSDGGYATSGFVVAGVDGQASLVVTGIGSNIQTGSMSLGISNEARMRILGGGTLNSTNATVGVNSDGNGVITVDGDDSHWNNSGDLTFGNTTASTMEINNDGLVTVAGTTFVNRQSTVSINGGRFEFGRTDLASFNQFEGNTGSVAGNITIDGYNHVETLTPVDLGNVDVTDVSMANFGIIYGDGVSRVALNNTTVGEVRVLSNQSIRFGGINNVNSGEIHNFGGLVEFENDFVNKNEGFVGGRGQFIAGGGHINLGVMAFTAGATDILGDFVNEGNGQIISSGSAITTFFDDVVHNGTEIRTAEGSQTVFLGDYSGNSMHTGDGDVFFEGDLRPGNSPGVVSFEGSVFFGGGAMTQIEIGGLNIGDFDQLDIGGDLTVDGQLSVELLDGFSLGDFQEFLIADIDGSLTGQFDGLIEGDVVGRYGGRDLFISYSGGDGNDISLYSTVPEPGGAMFVMLLGIGFAGRRSRRS